MSNPSDAAKLAAKSALSGKGTPPSYALRALAAAHDPALGLDRSVCLRDVVERVRVMEQVGREDHASPTADFIEREFTDAP